MATIRTQAANDASRLYSSAKTASWILQTGIWVSGMTGGVYGCTLLSDPTTNIIGLEAIAVCAAAVAISSASALVFTRGAMAKAQILRAHLGLLEGEAPDERAPLFPSPESLFPKNR